MSIPLAYLVWALSPLLAYQGLMMGLQHEARRFALLAGLYVVVAGVLWLGGRAEIAAAPGHPLSLIGLIVPVVGTLIVSLALFALGWRGGRP